MSERQNACVKIKLKINTRRPNWGRYRHSELLLTEASSHTFAAVSSRVFGLRVLIFNLIVTHAAVSSRVFGLRVFACSVC